MTVGKHSGQSVTMERQDFTCHIVPNQVAERLHTVEELPRVRVERAEDHRLDR